MKAFAIYTVLRLGLLLTCFAVFLAIWVPIFGTDSALVWPLLAAMVVSSLLSMKYLSGRREAFAQQVQARAARASSRMDEVRAREDRD